MASHQSVPPYLGRVLRPDESPGGTCFEVAPSILITASHVLGQMSLSAGETVVVQCLDGSAPPMEARILAMDPNSDVAILRGSRPFTAPVAAMAPTDNVSSFTQVIITGVADIDDVYDYNWIDATGEWQGRTQRAGLVHLGRLHSQSVVPGMSGAPVRRAADDVVIGLVSARYNSQDQWMRDSVWIARTEHILQLLGQTVEPAELASLDIKQDDLALKSRFSEAEFKSRVEDALKIAGYDVTPDEQVNGQAFDLVGRTSRWHKRWLVGVICLPGRQPVSQKDLAVLWLDYEQSFSRGAISELLVVTEVPPSLQAANWAEASTRLVVQTLASLTGGGLDLRGYLKTAEQLFADDPDGLAHYYIPAATRDGADLEDEVLKWIDDDPKSSIPLNRPLAILGSYGLGKTSFAIKLTSALATRAARDDFARVPILIRLGDIASEQSLEGLIGAHFTAANPVPGYSFPTLQDMNRQGRLVVIFDGFDEMKHLLTWAEFKFNLNQINRMVVEESKVILLGRPTAFENDDEQSEALHGQIPGPLVTTSASNGANYVELELAPLDNARVRTFIERYLAYQASKNGRRYDMAKIWRQIESPQLRDISRRPVQLRMLAEILPDYVGDIEDMDLVTVYDTFVNQILHQVMVREGDKKHRLAFEREVRRDFLTQLAFWMWEQRGTGILTSDQIPNTVVSLYASGQDINRARRDLVIASPLDRRYGERIRFAHRSFQEFLVAEEALRRLRCHEMSIQQYDNLATDEVAGFLKLLRQEGDAELISDMLRKLTGSISWRAADSLLAAPAVIEGLAAALRGSGGRDAAKPLMPWEILLPFLPVIGSGAATKIRPEDLVAQARMSDEGSTEVALLCLFLNGALMARHGADGAPAIGEILHMLLRGSRGARETVEAESDEKQKRRSSSARGRTYLVTTGRAGDKHQSADDRIPFLPLERGFVGDARVGYTRLGRYLTRAQLFQKNKTMKRESLAIDGDIRVEIRWLPDPVVEIAQALRRVDNGADMRSLGPVFARHLPGLAFVRDWTGPDGLRSPIRLPADLSISDQVAREALNIRMAWRSYLERLEQVPQRETHPPTG